MGWYELDCSSSGLGQVECSSEYSNEPLGSVKFLSNCTTGFFPRRAQLDGVSLLVTYQPRTNFVKNENNDLLADSRNCLNRFELN
jgi:hypothetical protein